jgi:hypothetical protein
MTNDVKWVSIPKKGFNCPNIKAAWVTNNDNTVSLVDNLQAKLWGHSNIIAYAPITNKLTSLLYRTSLIEPPKPYEEV